MPISFCASLYHRALSPRQLLHLDRRVAVSDPREICGRRFSIGFTIFLVTALYIACGNSGGHTRSFLISIENNSLHGFHIFLFLSHCLAMFEMSYFCLMLLSWFAAPLNERSSFYSITSPFTLVSTGYGIHDARLHPVQAGVKYTKPCLTTTCYLRQPRSRNASCRKRRYGRSN